MPTTLGMEVALSLDLEPALEQVAEALKGEGFGILTRIDVRATLKEKLGADFRPYVILGACHPPSAHRALTADPRVGLMLPCNVTVEAAPGGGTVVRIVNPEAMMMVGDMANDPVMKDVAGEARHRLERVAASLARGA